MKKNVLLANVLLFLSTLICTEANDNPTTEKETSAKESQDNNLPLPEITPNTWVNAKLNYDIPDKYKQATWDQIDGYCDSLYRSKTGTILVRSGIRSKLLGLKPGYYSNAWMEWDLKDNKIEIIDVFNWEGGSGGGGKLLPDFKENPTPSPRHTYDGLAYVPETDTAYLMFGATWKICRTKETTNDEAARQLVKDEEGTWKFSFKDRKWTYIKGNPWDFVKTGPHDVYAESWPYKKKVVHYETHMTYWSEGGKLMYLNHLGTLYCEFDLKTEKWVKVETSNKCPGKLYGARSTWDIKRQLWLFRNNRDFFSFNPKTKSFEKLPDIPAPANIKQKTNINNEIWKGITYISKHDACLVNWEMAKDTYIYNFNEAKWTQINGGEETLFNGYLEYDDKTDLIGLVYQRNAYKFRYMPNK